ncbi:asparagine synthase (glutamine-hydrolyzing) [Desulfopila sp. IMCC35008]|uniref:asparagine synthase (glutamine-hydrolyzing) n=1 Tax=Desulfopila sp. IMCC35008 TaxID=2653858 RepID=UPI001F0E0B46|nr:asparagine synthase (glutamine-hydrolyzing) [Desulfopila sp. IMCC35008]
MCTSLSHRGPDAAGMLQLRSDGKRCSPGDTAFMGLAHRRLSIIDLTDAGRQPMPNEDEAIWIVFNGECYNYQSLVDELVREGHAVRSCSDTEALIHGYEEWGVEKLLPCLNGMFAFALWDQKKRCMVLARDRLGKKPLYYILTDEGTLVFASEIKALIAGGFVDTGALDYAALAEFWLYGYTSGERTVFKQVKRLEPGHFAVFQDGRFTKTEYWDCIFTPEEDGQRSIDDYCDELEELLTDSIRLRLISDVPVGVFLSSGIDSSLISALTAKLTGGSVDSFSIGFDNDTFDESKVAHEIANHIGMRNTRLMVNVDFAPYFKPIATHFDELFGDSSAIPTFFVCREARKHVTVVLTGDAGDELFAGYDSYTKAMSLWGSPKQKWLMRKRTSLFQSIVDFAQLGFKRGDERFLSLERVMPISHLKHVFNEKLLSKVELDEVFSERQKWFSRVSEYDLLSAFQYLSIKTYLPDDVLVKVDRMSMYHALECRSPFLDYRIVEYAAKLPFSLKIDPHGERKYLLRKLLGRYVPKSITERPKMGFSVPWSDWCTGRMKKSLQEEWFAMNSPLFKKEAAYYLFPENKPGWPARQWNSLCTRYFFEEMTGKHRPFL